MEAKQRKNLAKMGGRVATVQEFLGLSDAEVRLIDLRIQLTRELRERRTARKVTQAQLAKLLGTSQPRVAAMEAGDPQRTFSVRIALFRSADSRKRRNPRTPRKTAATYHAVSWMEHVVLK